MAKFFQVLLGFSLMIFLINMLDSLDRVKNADTPFYAVMLMGFLQVPTFLSDVISSLVLIAAIITFFMLSSKSEITVIRMSGFSLWQVLRPIAICSTLLGIFWSAAFEPLTIQMSKKLSKLEGKYFNNDDREVVAPAGGIWLKQINNEKPDEELVIQAKKVYQQNLELDNVAIWFFNKNGEFYKKIDANEMFMKDNFWLLEGVTVNDAESINQTVKSLTIPTNLSPEFIMQKIVNNFQNVKLFTVFELPTLIEDLQSAGFNSVKFKVYFNVLLSKPISFLAMAFIACFFGMNHIRSNNTIVMIFLGIIFGLILYIISGIMNTLGSSGLIPIFASTWLISLICLAIGTLLIYRKENL